MAKIQAVQAREILDARGIPTIETTLWLDSGYSVTTSAPSGTSIGKYEALELRDRDQNWMLGKGVRQAVKNVNEIIGPSIIGQEPGQQKEIDDIIVGLDGTPNLSKLGANAILSVSQAVLKAGALDQGLPLYQYIQQKYGLTQSLTIPASIYGIINGGEHGADNLDIQEFQIIPASHIDFPNSLNLASTLQSKLEDVLVARGATHSIGLLGGFTPNLYNNTDVFEILVETIKTTPYIFAQDVFFGIDASAKSFYENGSYKLRDNAQPYSTGELVDYYKNIREAYKVIYIEDPFEEDDLNGWKAITNELGNTTSIVGDSFLVTNKEKMNQAIAEKSCNSVLVKPNQVGTISESIEVCKIAKEAGWQVVVSHRSGETNDDLIADFAVGVGADYTKFGPTNRGERIVKYNRLLKIHQELLEMSQQQVPAESNI
ncbi:MAG: phosphopyruvate hydratase [Patescibacteria group bacterium]